ncbi:MAG TPA: hypothetical protein VEI82_03160, partial [Myxococcota bacterium]|nr:hypothetical protein [Myxococcota bacterium]
MAEPTQSMPADVLQRMMAMMSSPPSDVPGLRKMLDQFAELLNAGTPEIGALHENVPVREVDGARVTADVFVPKGKGPHP